MVVSGTDGGGRQARVIDHSAITSYLYTTLKPSSPTAPRTDRSRWVSAYVRDPTPLFRFPRIRLRFSRPHDILPYDVGSFCIVSMRVLATYECVLDTASRVILFPIYGIARIGLFFQILPLSTVRSQFFRSLFFNGSYDDSYLATMNRNETSLEPMGTIAQGFHQGLDWLRLRRAMHPYYSSDQFLRSTPGTTPYYASTWCTAMDYNLREDQFSADILANVGELTMGFTHCHYSWLPSSSTFKAFQPTSPAPVSFPLMGLSFSAIPATYLQFCIVLLFNTIFLLSFLAYGTFCVYSNLLDPTFNLGRRFSYLIFMRHCRTFPPRHRDSLS